MTYPHAKHINRASIRSTLAVVMVLVLMAWCGPWSRNSNAADWSAISSLKHGCCCGPTCGSAKCCCTPVTRPSGDPVDHESPGSLATVESTLVAIASSPCIGPMPCGGDQEATLSLMSPRERPANLSQWNHPAKVKTRPPLPCFIDQFRAALPGDLPDEPPESSHFGERA